MMLKPTMSYSAKVAVSKTPMFKFDDDYLMLALPLPLLSDLLLLVLESLPESTEAVKELDCLLWASEGNE